MIDRFANFDRSSPSETIETFMLGNLNSIGYHWFHSDPSYRSIETAVNDEIKRDKLSGRISTLSQSSGGGSGWIATVIQSDLCDDRGRPGILCIYGVVYRLNEVTSDTLVTLAKANLIMADVMSHLFVRDIQEMGLRGVSLMELAVHIYREFVKAELRQINSITGLYKSLYTAALVAKLTAEECAEPAGRHVGAEFRHWWDIRRFRKSSWPTSGR